jgi:ADP-heptose:LPS heptosyltransferase
MPKKIPISQWEYTKAAIIRFGGKDEIIQTLPTIRVLKRQYENIQIHFVVKEEFADILKEIKEIDKIHAIKKEPWALTKIHDELVKEFIPLVLDLQNDFQSGFLYSAFPGAPKRMYCKYMIESFLEKYLQIAPKNPIPPLWKRFLHTLPRQNYEVLDADFELQK